MIPFLAELRYPIEIPRVLSIYSIAKVRNLWCRKDSGFAEDTWPAWTMSVASLTGPMRFLYSHIRHSSHDLYNSHVFYTSRWQQVTRGRTWTRCVAERDDISDINPLDVSLIAAVDVCRKLCSIRVCRFTMRGPGYLIVDFSREMLNGPIWDSKSVATTNDSVATRLVSSCKTCRGDRVSAAGDECKFNRSSNSRANRRCGLRFAYSREEKAGCPR